MSHKYIQELTLRLSSALDQNYNVINVEEVLSVINLLESSTITKNQLESTRLAKYVNQLRRRTKNEYLARRAKSLLKKWREMVGMQQQNAETIKHNPPHNSSISALGNENSQILQSFNRSSTCRSRSQCSSPVICGSLTHCGNSVALVSSTNANLKANKIKEIEKPTSFANIINFNNISNNITKSSKLCHKQPLTSCSAPVIPLETLIIDHSSNSEFEEIMRVSENKTFKDTNDPSIIIDLQDTNSIDNSVLTQDPTGTTFSAAPAALSPFSNHASLNKKKTESEITRNGLVYEDTIHSRSALTLHHNIGSRLTGQKAESRNLYTLCNVSEILSLSNSSMTSIFPKETMQESANQHTEKNSTILKQHISDLTFVGKFKHTTGSPFMRSFSSPTNSNVSCFMDDLSNHAPNTTTPLALQPLDLSQQNFTPFSSLMVINSKDSTASTSHISSFHVSSTSRKPFKENTFKKEEMVENNSAGNVIGKLSSTDFRLLKVHEEIETQKIVKAPKKRGRKKGSKSTHASIAKETSLSSEILMRGAMGCKKVKTTKELYAEIKNRKLASCFNQSLPSMNTISSSNSQPTQNHLLSPFSCSESSIHSPRILDAFSANATPSALTTTQSTPAKCISYTYQDAEESDGVIFTSEPSGDSTLKNNDNYVRCGKVLIDYNSNSGLDVQIVPGTHYHTAITSVRAKLHDLISKFPPIPKIQAIEDESKDVASCICCVVEVKNAEINENVEEQNFLNAEDNLNTKNSPSKESERNTNYLIGEDSEHNESERITRVMTKNTMSKSIFDVDFDDDNDPLHTLIADLREKKNINTNYTPQNVIVIPIIEKYPKMVHDAAKSKNNLVSPKLSFNKKSENCHITQLPTSVKFLSHIMLEKQEDEKCPAKYRFEIQTQQITEFHIYALHNLCIPNVNGNWNETQLSQMNSNLECEEVDDGYKVVPKYSSLIKTRQFKKMGNASLSKQPTSSNVKTAQNSYELKEEIEKPEDINIINTPLLALTSNTSFNSKVSSTIEVTNTNEVIRDPGYNTELIENVTTSRAKSDLNSELDAQALNQKFKLCFVKNKNKENNNYNEQKSMKLGKKTKKRQKPSIYSPSSVKRLRISFNGDLLKVQRKSRQSSNATTDEDENENDNMELKEDVSASSIFYSNKQNMSGSNPPVDSGLDIESDGIMGAENNKNDSSKILVENENYDLDVKNKKCEDEKNTTFTKTERNCNLHEIFKSQISSATEILTKEGNTAETDYPQSQVNYMDNKIFRNGDYLQCTLNKNLEINTSEKRPHPGKEKNGKTLNNTLLFKEELCPTNKYILNVRSSDAEEETMGINEYNARKIINNIIDGNTKTILKNLHKKIKSHINDEELKLDVEQVRPKTYYANKESVEENSSQLLSFNKMYSAYNTTEPECSQNNSNNYFNRNRDSQDNWNKNIKTDIVKVSPKRNSSSTENSCSSLQRYPKIRSAINRINNGYISFPEYRNDWLLINEDIKSNYENWQTFAEWHQVLQVHSYNDEVLTILPYVLLE